MFVITYQNEVNVRWNDDLVFRELDNAKKHLTQQGFIENNRIFERKDYGWSKYLKAYINPTRVYEEE